MADDLITLQELAECIPSRAGRHVGVTAVWKWAEHGRRAGDGRRVKLKTERRFGRLETSWAW